MVSHTLKLVDTHCHINMMIKKEFDVPLSPSLIPEAQKIVTQANNAGVTTIINVGTSLIESNNCLMLAQKFPSLFATVGIHPNDCTKEWRTDFEKLKALLPNDNIVGIGEIGIDRHYPDYNLQRQNDAFRAQLELALEHDLGIVIHSRDAYDETLRVLEEYKYEKMRAVMHCFSYDQNFADQIIQWGLYLGIGGTITYPKNKELRQVCKSMPLEHIVLETDAPFLPIQPMRGKQNSPKFIKEIAQFLAELRGDTFESIAQKSTNNSIQLFKLH